MHEPSRLALITLLLLTAPAQAADQANPDVVERGRKATALVEVTTPRGEASGSGFCIDKAGLFITNAHVVEDEAGVRLVLDIGLKSQRRFRAKVLRVDDEYDLALLKVDADLGLTPLELAKDDTLVLTDPVTTFGFPFGHMAAIARGVAPDVTVIRSRVTSLKQENAKIRFVQFDGQLNPGNSGGPVLDDDGRVVGVAVATVRGAAMNLAIPVRILSAFLKAPGLVFDPPPLAYKDRSQPVTWTFTVRPPTPIARLPEGLSVVVKLTTSPDDTRTITAVPFGGGVFKAKIAPVPRDPDRKVELAARFPNGELYRVEVKDGDVRVGKMRFMLSDLRSLIGGPSPQAHSTRGPAAFGPIVGLGKVKTKTKAGKKSVTIDLSRASRIDVRALDPPTPVQAVEALVEVRQGAKVLATVHKRADFSGAPVAVVRVAPGVVAVVPQPAPRGVMVRPPLSNDEGRIQIGGVLDVDGVPLGAGAAVRPPKAAMGGVRLTPGPADPGPPLVRSLEGAVSDVAVGGGGRFLLLTMKDVGKVAAFDANAADVVKTIPLASPNALVAAGAKRLLVAFPDERVFHRWNLETMTREVSDARLPFEGRLKGLALGSDSEGPALVAWSPDGSNVNFDPSRFSFIDLVSLKVLKIGPVATAGTQRAATSSSTGGSLTLYPSLTQQVHVRGSSGGGLFGFWQTLGRPSGFQTLTVNGKILKEFYSHENFGYLAPGPDGRTIYTGLSGRRNAIGHTVGLTETHAARPPETTIPSPDPLYYLTVEGEADPSKLLKASVHVTGSGTRLFTVYGLDEMSGAFRSDGWAKDDFTLEKRFHFLPAARLLVTIPMSNDRLVLRRIDVDQVLARLPGDYLFVTSPSYVTANAGQSLVHQIESRSKKGGVTYTLTRGPEGLVVSPTGTLSWPSPQKPDGEDATAVVTVSDASGREVFHTITLRVN